MTEGILMVVFGREYERFAVDCLLERHTSKPIHLLINFEPKYTRWNELSGVTTKYFGMKDNDNRVLKLSAIDHSPFDRTLLLDCDVVIQKEIDFNILNGYDIALNRLLNWNKGEKILSLYRRAFELFNVNLPITIYNGAFIMFDKTDITKQVFRLWFKYWNDFGRWREMPCLNSVIANMNINVKELNKGIFEPEVLNPDAVIQHDCLGFSQHFGIKPINKTNAMISNADWHWVEYQ